jgi:hypothetical protein
MKLAIPKIAKVIGILLLIAAFLLMIFFVFGGNKQSILSLSKITVGTEGKVYWTWFASANKPGESYIFTYNPSKYSFENNSGDVTVTPKSSLTLVVNPLEKQCKYQLQKSTYNSKYNYYLLKNPSRFVNLTFTDGNGKTQSINGASNQQIVISDSDNKGEVVIETQGLLMSESDCPDYDNVAVLLDIKTNQYAIGYKDEITAWINSHSSVWCYVGGIFGFCGGNVNPQDNTAFMSSFDNISVSSTELIGDINFGNPTFTITADSDYFDSTYYIEPVIADPQIGSVSIPSEIKQDASSSGKVSIINAGDDGSVHLEISSNGYSISPSTSTFILDNSKEISFTIKAGTTIGCNDIDFEVCSVSQFTSSQNCDTESINVCTVSSSSQVEIECGDGTCSPSESYSNCPTDCSLSSGNITELDCKWYQSYSKVNSCGAACILGFEQPKAKSSCDFSPNLIFAVFVLIVLIVVSIPVSIKIVKVVKNKKHKRRK